MAWKCACGTENELYSLCCTECNEQMPQHERNKIYIQELFNQIKECMVLLKNSAPARYVRSLILSLVENISETLKGTKKEDLKYALIPLAVFAIIIVNVVVQVAGDKIDYAREQRYHRNAYFSERRADISENIRTKLISGIDRVTLKDETKSENQLAAKHIESKKNHLEQKFQIVLDFATENVKRGYEKCRLYFE